MHDEDPLGASPLRVGMRLDRYDLVASLASGGMGAVWLARLHGVRGFEKLVAIKTIRPQYSSSGRFERMFLDEARIASRIQHPNIAPILELGEQDGLLYLVMEYVDGETLSRLRRAAHAAGERVPLGVALRVLADACAGLHAAHELEDERGEQLCVVHRDASPHNILVATNGTVKLIDFGVAKARDRCAEETTIGQLKGKLQYMPREQAMADDIDRRADVWSIGACLYELVAGHAAWEPASVATTMRRLKEAEPPRPLLGEVPPIVAQIIARSLVHDRERRFPTALAMKRALEHAITSLGLRAASEDVAAHVRRLCADTIEDRRRVIADAMASSSSSRQRVAPASLANDRDDGDETPCLPRSGTSLTRAARPGKRAAETHPGDLRTPTPTANSSPPRFSKPRRRSSLGLLGLGVVALAALGVFLVRRPASSIRHDLEVPTSAALSPLSAPSAPVVDHVASPTCPSDMAVVAEPLTWTPYCIDRVAIAIEGACAKSGGCAARATATRYCLAHGKRLATDAELALAKSNDLVDTPKTPVPTKTKPRVTTFRCARSL